MPYTGDMGAWTAPQDAMTYGQAPASVGQQAAESYYPTNAPPGAAPGFGTLLGMAAMAPMDLVDTLASNKLTQGITGIQRGDVDNAVLNFIGKPGLSQFYSDHQAGIEAMSGVGGLVASSILTEGLGGLAGEALRSSEFMRSVPFAKRILSLGQEADDAISTVKAADVSLASSGAMGVEQYTGTVNFTGNKAIDSALENFTPKAWEGSRGKLVFGAKVAGALKGGVNAALHEAVAYAALNSNGFLYSDDAGQNMAWQALGIAGGAGMEWLHAGYKIRSFVNGDLVKRAFANALDPEGFEASRLLWKDRKVGALPEDEGFMGGTYSDQITSLSSSASSLRQAAVGSGADDLMNGTALSTGNNRTNVNTLLANRNHLATQFQDQAINTYLPKITNKGISTNGYTRFNAESDVGWWNHVTMALNNDPTALYGVEQMGAIPDGKTAMEIHGAHMDRLGERILENENAITSAWEGGNPKNLTDQDVAGLINLNQRLRRETQLTPSVFVDGEKMPISAADSAMGFTEVEPKFTPDQSGGIFGGQKGDKTGLFEWISPGSKTSDVSLDTSFGIHMSSGRNLNDADHFDIRRLYRLGAKAIDTMAGWEGPITLPDKPNWFHLDMAESILQKNPEAKIIWPKGMDRDSAQVESFAQKVEGLGLWQNRLRNGKLDPTGLMQKLRVRFNLPGLTPYEMGLSEQTLSPVEMLARGGLDFGPSEIRKMDLADLKQSVAQVKRVNDMVPITAKDVQSLSGNSFNYMLDGQGRPLKPILTYTRPFRELADQWTPEALHDRIAARKMLTVQKLTDNEAAPLTQNLTAAIMSDQNFNAAASTHMLMDNQIQGSIFGAAPQSASGAFGNAFSSREQIARDSPGLLAAGRLKDNADSVSRQYMKQIINGAFGDSLNQLKNPRNIASKTMLDSFHSFSPGWDLLDNPVQTPEGLNAFKLGDTQRNRLRWKQAYGSDMPSGQLLVNPEGKTVVMDDRALDIQQRFNKATNALMDEKNTALRAQGLPEIQSRNWYVPPPNTNNKYIGMVLGPDGKPVPGMGVVATTPQDYATQKAIILKQMADKNMGIGYSFRGQQEIQDFASIWDKAHADMINPGTTAVQAGKSNRGVLSGAMIRPDAFENSLQYVRDGFTQHSTDVLQTLLDDQIKSNQARSAVAAGASLNKPSAKTGVSKFNSIYDMWNQNVLGINPLSTSGSPIGKFYNWAEGTLDQFLSGAQNHGGAVWDAVNGFLNKHTPWDSSYGAKKDFESLSNALGQYNPFTSLADYIEKQGLGKSPVTSAQIGQKLNSLTNATVLRMFEFAQPLIHMTGTVNSMPAVIRSFLPMEGEDAASHAARVGHLATMFNLPDKTSMGILDMGKLAAGAFKDAWTPGNDARWEYRIQRGFLGQEVAEFHRQFASIESRDSWERIMLGDNTITKPANIRQTIQQKGIIGSLSTLTDNSLEFSRSWAHMAGVRLADHLGIDGMVNQENFAHDFANKMIANYSPHNRPEIFQGALGTNIGLFQSFMQAYYQRLFRYVETKDMGSLISQLVTQGGIFGVNSLPGWPVFNSVMNAASSTHQDPESQLYHTFGMYPGDIVSHGVLSNIPTIFGQEGASLFTRGDANIRVVGTAVPPSWQLLGKIASGIVQGFQAFKDNNGDLSPERLTEILANMMPSRPLAGIIEQAFNHGEEVDAAGQLKEDTNNAAQMIYRLIGIRSMRQADDLQGYYANKSAMAQKASQMDILRLATRAAMRDGDSDALPAIFQKYLENGGDPHFFQRWVKDNYRDATTTRSQRQLDAALKDPKKMDQVMRLLDLGVSTDANDKTPDPQSLFGQGDQGDELTGQPGGGLGDYSGQVTAPSLAPSPDMGLGSQAHL